MSVGTIHGESKDSKEDVMLGGIYFLLEKEWCIC